MRSAKPYAENTLSVFYSLNIPNVTQVGTFFNWMNVLNIVPLAQQQQ